jgi:two-component system sensor histidine kinase PilS (NtrC family)
VLAALASLVAASRYRERFNLQLSVQVLVDILVLTLLMHVGGGLRSGLGALLLVTLAGAGLVGQGRLVLFYAAAATLAALFAQFLHGLGGEFDATGFFETGLFSAGFFGVSISALLLARRVSANEELARRRGIDLNNQMLISQRVLEEMQDGVLVVSQNGRVKQHNPRAERLLGLPAVPESRLAEYSPELAQGFSSWCVEPDRDPLLVRASASGKDLRARFAATGSSERDVVVFLEDMGRLQEQAQQLKLAALGRLTANIAHEIRNPLSAISHAGELLVEEASSSMQERLLRIVLDNTQRLDRIVSDVLELGRRDRAQRELIALGDVLPMLVDDFAANEKVDPAILRVEVSGTGFLCFDRSHFHQVLSNLLGNALRHCRRELGSIRVLARDAAGAGAGGCEIVVSDDGEGVPAALREQVFEPFFTTHHRGTGLGLYIARELAEANGARLELLATEPGAHFRLSGGFEHVPEPE